MVCCDLETLVWVALLNVFLPDRLTVCGLDVCDLGPSECFIFKMFFYAIGFYQRALGIHGCVNGCFN